jgi:predicted acylesterase/phospholipase RssA/tetratricopeptide (TPR) repeat protein
MIYTFYSFKGGVGRSMALANIAEAFYLNGLKVVMVDWDLEAPGLESYFFEREPNASTSESAPLEGVDLIQSRLGLIDLLTEYKRSFSVLSPVTSAGVEDWAPKAFRGRIADDLKASREAAPGLWQQLDEHLPLSTYLYPIHLPTADQEAGLWLLPAGWRHQDRFQAYAEAVQAFDWEDFYLSFRGKEFFDWMRSRLLDFSNVVLIDSRTGVTEMGGVCARQMADVVVSFCAPNSQNVEGVTKMVKSFRKPETMAARDHRSLETLVIPTRVDPQEVQKLEEFVTRFERAVNEEEDAPDVFREVGSTYWDLRIPYRTVYSYEERRVIGPGIKDLDPTRGLETAYRKITSHLALLAEEGSIIRQRFTADLERQFPALLPKVALLQAPGAEEQARGLRKFLDDASVKLWPDITVGEDPSRWTTVVSQAIHLIIATSATPDLTSMREPVRLARQLGRWIHVVGPQREWRPPAWLQEAWIFPGPSAEWLEKLRVPKAGLRAPQMWPPPTGVFVDRPELQARLKSLLLEGAKSKARTCYALWGEGGSGKSALAAAVARDDEVSDAFPDGILWVNAGDAAAMAQLLTALTGETPAGDVAPTRVAELLRGRRVLLVIDDAWNASDLSVLMELGDRATRLVLTRNLDLAATVAQTVVTVGSMTPAEAARLLTGSANGEELAEKLGNSPLALALARASLDQQLATQTTLPEALERADEQLQRHGIVAFDVIGERGVPAQSARSSSIAASVGATVAQLAGWQRRRLQQLVQVCRDRSVTFDEVSRVWDQSGYEAGEPHPFDARERLKLIQRLNAFALIEWNSKAQSIRLQGMYRRLLEAQGIIGDRTPPALKRRLSSASDRRTNADVDRVKRVLGGEDVAFEEAVQLYKRLKEARYFGYARQLLARTRRMPEASETRLWLAQQHALCTYKDTDLGNDQRSKRALQILDEADPLNSTTEQETLGLAGAVYKYKWMADGQLAHLERSVAYYLRGHAQGIKKDWGYTAINAAFVLDLLAHQEDAEARQAGAKETEVNEKRERATRIRQEIADELPKLARTSGNEWLAKQWWFLVTVAEAFFGLGRHEEATFWLKEATALEVVEWEFESTARQLARLAWSQNGGAPPAEGSPAAITLNSFLGNDAAAVESVVTGKVGLALSGGGFRASLFHIGVLARLAEMDLLRRIDVLSCVSGGSIIGAHYYLEVRSLLQSKPDGDITRSDYIALIRRLEHDFLAGVQRNLRSRLFANPWIGVKCAFMPRYNRTDRLGELFETDLFSRVEGKRKWFARKKKWWLNGLTIQPKSAPPDFAPKLDNWRRINKVPVLILNATTLNTGHNWQFTATWMGEPPAGAGSEVDTNDLLRRMYYWEAPSRYGAVRLGRAVAASACVPGLFDPVQLDRLFPARSVRLVDGGVHDNQGIAGLLEQECSVLLVSDASGHMESEHYPGAGRFRSLKRSNAIAMARVREIEFRDLDSRFRSSQIKGLTYLHLKKGLEVDPIDWVGCVDPYDTSADAKPVEARGPLTPYGIPKSIQEKIAGLRTDLDSFTDFEAYALMYSGYRMAGSKWKEALPGLDLPPPAAQADWQFLTLEKTVTKAKDFDDAHDDLRRLLAVGGSNGLKIWRLWGVHWLLPVLAIAAVALNPDSVSAFSELATGLVSMTLYLSLYGMVLLFTPTTLLVLAGAALAGSLLRFAGWQRPWTRLGAGVLMSTLGWIPWALHQHVVDPLFLFRGRVPSTVLATATATWKSAAAAVLLLILAIMPVVNRWQARAQVRSQGYQALQGGSWQDAAVAWGKVIESDSRDADARLGRAWANRELGQYPQAIADYTEAIKLGRNDAIRERAFAYLLQGSWKEAAEDWDRVIKTARPDNVDARDVEARLGRAWANRELGKQGDSATRYSQAIADYTEAIGRGRKDALKDRAYAYRLAGQRKEAAADERAFAEWNATRNPSSK